MSKTKETSKGAFFWSGSARNVRQLQESPYDVKKIKRSFTFTMPSPLKSAVHPDMHP